MKSQKHFFKKKDYIILNGPKNEMKCIFEAFNPRKKILYFPFTHPNVWKSEKS